jgi:hypothetical protein
VQHKNTYLNFAIQCALLVVKLLVVVGEHLEVVESEFLLDALLESLTLLNSEGVGLGDDGNNIDDIWQLLQHHDVNGLQGVAGGLNKEQAGVDAGVLDVTLTLGCELLSQVRGVLILDILDDRIPAAIVVHEIAVARGIDNVQAQTDAVLLNDVWDGLDLGGGADGLIGLKAALGVDEVGGEDSIDQSWLAEPSLA